MIIDSVKELSSVMVERDYDQLQIEGIFNQLTTYLGEGVYF